MNLSKSSLKAIASKNPNIIIPNDSIFTLPEKVLQFGTGVLLRGLPDYFIDKANRQNIFNGRIVVVKSTDEGSVSTFDNQDNLYTLCVRGLINGEKTEGNIVCSAISRVLSAKSQWKEVLKCAFNPDLQVIISNTTEVGIQFVDEDIKEQPPVSFPGKLLAFLYERYRAFNGDEAKGMVIIPTELITDNGDKLKAITIRLSKSNELPEAFTNWIENSNYFCNSLVDRIVPGKPNSIDKLTIENQLGYTDELLILSEVYRLWAIQGDEYVQKVLSFAQCDEGVIIAPDIELFRELKLRMLNGTHTFCCGVAFLSGITTVKEAMEDATMVDFIKDLMFNEIAPSIPNQTAVVQADNFGIKVLDRFRNPLIEHLWINITAQYTSKMRMRNIPLIKRWFELNQTEQLSKLPEKFGIGFAAYLLFMKTERGEDGRYYGNYNNAKYLVNDDMAEKISCKWTKFRNPTDLVKEVLSDKELWGLDLCTFPGLQNLVIQNLEAMLENGVREVVIKSISR